MIIKRIIKFLKRYDQKDYILRDSQIVVVIVNVLTFHWFPGYTFRIRNICQGLESISETTENQFLIVQSIFFWFLCIVKQGSQTHGCTLLKSSIRRNHGGEEETIQSVASNTSKLLKHPSAQHGLNFHERSVFEIPPPHPSRASISEAKYCTLS